MRVGLVCPYDLSKPGGVQAQVLGLAKALAAGGDEVAVIGPGLPPDVSGVDLGDTLSIPGNGSKVPISPDPRVLRKMRAATSEIDVLHVHEPLMPSVSLSALRVGLPVVATFHAAPGAVGNAFYGFIGFALNRILGVNVRTVTAVSATARNPLPDDLDVSIVPNGIDVASMRVDVPRDPLAVVFLGRDEPRKGLDVLLEAWPAVQSAVPDARLVVMGAAREVEGVDWRGVVDEEEKAATLNGSAVYVAPNLGGESFGIVLVEGMAAGVAVVASDLSAFVEVGEDAALYFPVGDADALADRLVTVLTDEELRAGLSEAGIERAAAFDWSVVAAEYRRHYESALS